MEATHDILLLDSNEQSAQEIQRFLKVSAYTFSVSHASDLNEGLNYIRNRKPEVLLLDSAFVQRNDFFLLKQVLERDNIPVILLSNTSEFETKHDAETAGAAEYIVKNKINLFHLQKSVLSALKISETETKLSETFNHYVTQQESFYQLVNRISSGVIIINSKNEILFANERAYSLLADGLMGRQIETQVNYREVNEEQLIEIRSGKNTSVSFKISGLEWNGERANLFMLEKKTLPEEQNDFAQNSSLNVLLNSVSENVLLLKGERIVYCNRHASQSTRKQTEELIGRNIKDVFEILENSTPRKTIQDFLSERSLKGWLKSEENRVREVEIMISPLNLSDEFYQLVKFKWTVTEEEKNIPKARTDEDRFTTDSVLHLASHDLREPVRTILNYVQLIADNLKKEKYEAANEYAGFAKDAASRMEKLLSDLKVLISLNDYQFTLGKVSMKLMVADILKQRKSDIETAGAEVTVSELPDVNADRELVDKLLAHLIDNALKFRKKDKKPVIDIGYDRFEGNVIFCVRDNGIGISKKYYNKIFEMFERLNRVDEYQGNGLGLAICKKIVDMHGGEIWVESLPGSGSNFYFTLKGS